MERQWQHVKPIKDLGTLLELKNVHHLQIPESFEKFIMTHNAGRTKPSPYIWLHKQHRGFMFYEVLDFSHARCHAYEVIYTMRDKLGKLSSNFYVPFGITKDKKGVFVIGDGAVHVCDTETREIMLVSSSFDIFYRDYLNNTIYTNN